MKQLTTNFELYAQFLAYLDDRIRIAQNTLESTTDPVQMYRAQGQIQALRRLKQLREEVNGGDQKKLGI